MPKRPAERSPLLTVGGDWTRKDPVGMCEHSLASPRTGAQAQWTELTTRMQETHVCSSALQSRARSPEHFCVCASPPLTSWYAPPEDHQVIQHFQEPRTFSPAFTSISKAAPKATRTASGTHKAPCPRHLGLPCHPTAALGALLEPWMWWPGPTDRDQHQVSGEAYSHVFLKADSEQSRGLRFLSVKATCRPGCFRPDAECASCQSLSRRRRQSFTSIQCTLVNVLLSILSMNRQPCKWSISCWTMRAAHPLACHTTCSP